MASSKKKGPVEKIALQCTECKQKNYTTEKNRRNTPNKLELMKYCPFEHKHTLHRETKQGSYRSIAPMVERRSPKPHVGGSSPSWPVGSLSLVF